MLQGKKNSLIDRTPKTIRFYSMFGELLEVHTDITGLERAQFRPRP